MSQWNIKKKQQGWHHPQYHARLDKLGLQAKKYEYHIKNIIEKIEDEHATNK